VHTAERATTSVVLRRTTAMRSLPVSRSKPSPTLRSAAFAGSVRSMQKPPAQRVALAAESDDFGEQPGKLAATAPRPSATSA
jgi:hypothetical protein